MVPGLCLSRAAPLCGPLTLEEQTLEGSILSTSDFDLTRLKYPLIRTQSWKRALLCQLTDKNGTLFLRTQTTTHTLVYQQAEICSVKKHTIFERAKGRVRKLFIFWQKQASKRPLFLTVCSSWLTPTHHVCQLGQDSG